MCHSWVYVYITIVPSYTSNLAFVVDFMYEAYTIPTYAILVVTSICIYICNNIYVDVYNTHLFIYIPSYVVDKPICAHKIFFDPV